MLRFVLELVHVMFNLRPIPLGSIPGIEPVFIVGAARSGTTPLQLALNMHPDLGVYGETQAFFVRRRFGAEPSDVSFRHLLEYWRVVVSGCCPYTDLLDDAEVQRNLAEASSYAQVLNVIMGAIAAREGKNRWGEKSPAHIFRLADIRAAFPNARIIHIVRDPRAVVCSNIKAFRHGQFNDWNVYAAAKYWVRCLNVHAGQVASQAERYTMIQYEDFVTQPKPTLASICSFLGITFADEMLSAHRVASDYVRPGRSGKMPALHALTEKPLDAERTDAWKKILDPAQSKLVEQIASDQMEPLGYQPLRKEYTPPKMRVSRLSPLWAFREGRRIAMKQIRVPYWALRRAVDLGKSAFKEAGTASS